MQRPHITEDDWPDVVAVIQQAARAVEDAAVEHADPDIAESALRLRALADEAMTGVTATAPETPEGLT